jgi:hypothetical protein
MPSPQSAAFDGSWSGNERWPRNPRWHVRCAWPRWLPAWPHPIRRHSPLRDGYLFASSATRTRPHSFPYPILPRFDFRVCLRGGDSCLKSRVVNQTIAHVFLATRGAAQHSYTFSSPKNHAPKNATTKPINGLSMVSQRTVLVTNGPCVSMSCFIFLRLRPETLFPERSLAGSAPGATSPKQRSVLGEYAPA